MRTRMTAMALAVGLAACGGGGDSPTASTPVAPPAPTKAVVTFNLDPKAQVAEYQGNGYWKFKVNMEFLESGGGGTGGVGYTVNTTRVTLSSPTGTILLDYNYAMAARVEANGRRVFQWTSPLYYTNYGTGNANVAMVASITDDKGNAMTVSSAMTVKHVGGEKVELP